MVPAVAEEYTIRPLILMSSAHRYPISVGTSAHIYMNTRPHNETMLVSWQLRIRNLS